MTIVSNAHFIALALAAVALVGCSENPSSPQAGKLVPLLNSAKTPNVEIKEGNEYSVVVNSEIELYDKHGTRIKKYKHKSDVHTKVVDGRLVSTRRRGLLENASLSFSSSFDEVPDSVDMMPVLGVATAEYASSYNDTQSDGEGNSTRIAGTSCTSGYPVNLVNAYLNDTLLAKVSMVWQTVSGGFTMATQTQNSYSTNGSIVAIIRSTPDYSTITIQAERSLPYRLAKSVQSGLNRAMCALGPSVAYASTNFVHSPAPVMFGCGVEVAVFAGETFALGVGTAVVGTNPWAIGAYLVGWGLWTHSLHAMMKCLK